MKNTQKLAFIINSSILLLFSVAASGVEPLFVKSAKIYTGPVLDSVLGYYHGRELEEISDLNAYEVQFDLTVPISKNTQLRLSVPAYTDGSGTVNNPDSIADGLPTDLDGYGGTYEFTTLGMEYQFKHAQQSGYDVITYGALGIRTQPLDTSHGDKMNHAGKIMKLGLRYEKPLARHDGRLLASFEYRHYWDTDDLNPGSDGDPSFGIVNISGAWVGYSGSRFSPAIELLYSTDVDDYHALRVVPELIVTINSVFDLKFGIPIGLTDDADEYGVRIELTSLF